MKAWLLNKWQENKLFVLFVVLMFVFRSAIADWNTVPTGSMKPTILEGDRILVNKMAYDIRVPFTHISLFKLADPARGDIVVFDSEVSGKKLVKRVIGIPGDIVELKENVLYINHQKITYKDISSTRFSEDKTENLFGLEHFVRLNKQGSHLSSFDAIEVPQNAYLTMGDNRDNSSDSRVIGFVPRNEIVGRSKSVVLSFNYDNYYIPRGDRFFHAL